MIYRICFLALMTFFLFFNTTHAQQIKWAKDGSGYYRIEEGAIVKYSLPQNNKTNITQEERDIIGCWIEQGASLK